MFQSLQWLWEKDFTTITSPIQSHNHNLSTWQPACIYSRLQSFAARWLWFLNFLDVFWQKSQLGKMEPLNDHIKNSYKIASDHMMTHFATWLTYNGKTAVVVISRRLPLQWFSALWLKYLLLLFLLQRCSSGFPAQWRQSSSPLEVR